MKMDNDKPFTEYRQEPTEVNEQGMSPTNWKWKSCKITILHPEVLSQFQPRLGKAYQTPRIQDGGGVGGRYTHLLSGPNWNYNWNIEQSTWKTNQRVAEQESYNQGFIEEATSRSTEMQKELILLTWAAVEIPEGYSPRRMGSKPHAEIHNLEQESWEGVPTYYLAVKISRDSIHQGEGSLLETQAPS